MGKKFIITQSQINDLINPIQNMINFALDTIREESEDWGMGEMDGLHEIGAIEKIKIVKERGQIQKQYIEKEIVKYNDKCVIPKEFIQVVNEAAASPSGGKDE